MANGSVNRLTEVLSPHESGPHKAVDMAGASEAESVTMTSAPVDSLRSLKTSPGTYPSSDSVTMTSTPGSIQPLPNEAAVEEIFLGEVPGQGERLHVQSTLGRGGMGRVMLATQRSLRRDVAVKVLHAAPSAYARESLLREALVVSRLEHPNIVPVYALGLDDRGRPALVMKRIDGVPWSALIKDAQHPAWTARLEQERDRLGVQLRILLAVSEAVHFAHRKGTFHRDIKPDNVMLGEFGEVYLTDWGIAVTASDQSTIGEGQLVGTPSMMAPEMLSGDPGQIDARTDVYLLGSTLHMVLTGLPRHPGTEHNALLRRVEESAPSSYPSTVPPELGAICNRATARDPEARFADAVAFRQALLDFLSHRSSLELSAAACERLGVLRELVERSSGPALTEEDTLRLQQAGSECRFGYELALRSWPENEAALAGVEETLALLALYEFGHGSLAAGRRLLASLRSPTPRLQEALAARELRERDGEQKVERLARIEAEFDLSTEAKHRRAIVVLILLPGLVLICMLAIAPLGHQGGVTVEGMLLTNTCVLVTMSTYTLLRRRVLLTTAINRRVVGFLFTLYASIFAHRVASVCNKATVAAVVDGDMAILLAGTAAATIGITRSLWPSPVALFAGLLIGSVAAPTVSLAHNAIYASAGLFGLGYFAFVWGRLRGSSLPGSSA